MATFALGTALGDLTAVTFRLGFLASGVLFAVVIAIPAMAHWRLGMNAVLAFWFAYVVTRPLGASFADWLGVPHTLGGLGLGRGVVSVFSTIVIIALVGYLAVTRKDADEYAASQPPARGQPPRGQPPQGQPPRGRPPQGQPPRGPPARGRSTRGRSTRGQAAA